MQRKHTILHGHRLAFVEHGTPRASQPSLLLLHGLIANAESFRLLAACLPQHHIVAIDMPGSGESDHVGITPDFDSLALLIKAFANALSMPRPVLLGHSHGGAICLRIAATDPGWPGGLILLCPAHPFSGSEEQLVRFYLSPPGRLFAKFIPKFPRWLMRAAFHWMPGRHLRLGREQLKPYLDTLCAPRTVPYTLRLLATWERDMAQLCLDLEAHPLAVPALLLWGARDLVVPPHTATGLLPHLPHAELVILKGVGHLPNDEAPEECARLISNWLKTAPALKPSTRTHPPEKPTPPK